MEPRASQKYCIFIFIYMLLFHCTSLFVMWIYIINTFKLPQKSVPLWTHRFSLLHPTKLEHFVYTCSEMNEVQFADTILKKQYDWKLPKMICYCFQKPFHTYLLVNSVSWEGGREWRQVFWGFFFLEKLLLLSSLA